MKTSFYDVLIEELKKEESFVSEDGSLLKNKVYESAMRMDENLIDLLFNNETLRGLLFKKIGDNYIFDKTEFGWIVNNKEFLPDSYTMYSNKIGLFDDNRTMITENGNVSLVWPYKDCVLEGGQGKNESKKSEIFYNSLLSKDAINTLLDKKVFSNVQRFNYDGTISDADSFDDDNLVIKGNNLLTIASLLPRFEKKIDAIYIDPPYNPKSKSNTFCYNNSFNRSTWLTFMKNRLEIAKRLLTPSGSLICAIDENEQVYLGVLLNEIFTEHEIHCITIVHNPRGVQGTNFSYTHEYAFFVIPKNKKSIGNRKIKESEIDWRNLRDNGGESLRTDAKNCFYPIIVNKDGDIVGFGDVVESDVHPSKQTEKIGDEYYVYPIDKEGIERKYRYARQSVEGIKHLLKAKKNANGFEILLGKDFGTYRTVWIDERYDANEYGTKIVHRLVPNCNFDFPKSLWNVYDCLYAVVSENKNARVLDFFGGSGTTAHAVQELNKDGGNRKFIIAEQMDYINDVTVPRIQKVMEENGKGNFIYCELAKNNENYCDKIQKIRSSDEAVSVLNDMLDNAFISERIDISKFKDNVDEFKKLSVEEQKSILMDSLDKNMLYINYYEMNDESYDISENDKKFNQSFYGDK